MKTKHLLMLPAISLAASTSSWGQAVAPAATKLPAAAKVNLQAELSEAKPAKELLDKLAALITEKAKEADEDLNVDGKAILEVLGLDKITSYAMSSEKDGAEWRNLMYLHNGGTDKGIFSLIGKKDAKLSAPDMCPAGSDLVLQLDLDLNTVEELIRNFMKAGNAPKEDQQEFEDQMMKEVPELEITTSALLSKINARVNFAIDLDDKVKLALPFVGELDKPRMVIRLDGLAWLWNAMGDDLIADLPMPFQKKEEDGITTYSLPAEMAAQFFGYSPLISIDKNKDQIWIASSPGFLKRSSSGTESLAESPAFKNTIKGLSQKGNILTYMSKDFADLLLQLHGIAKANGQLEQLGEEAADLDKAMEELKLMKNGTASILTRDEGGILSTERGVRNYQERLKEMEKAINKIQ